MNPLHLFRLLLAVICLALLPGCKTAAPMSPEKISRAQTNYVLVHGAWGGGWDWRPMDDLLTADGGKVFRATLTGQGERSHLNNTNIDLETHIQDVVNLIVWENLHDVVLVGHSYGGMVITGVADRIPERIKHLVYLDALLPENGESVDEIRLKAIKDQPVIDGFKIPSWVKAGTPPPHDVPQSIKTFSQSITLTNPAAAHVAATYILTVDAGKKPEQDDFYKFYQRAQARGWSVVTMAGDHNVQRTHQPELLKLIEQAAH